MLRDSSEGSIGTLSPAATPRRNSTGKIVSSIPNSLPGGREKVVPNYLRASTSSCHDLCKYGHKHSVDEQQPRHPFLRRKLDSNAASSKGDLAKGSDANRVKSLAVRSKVMPASKLTPREKIKADVPAKGLGANQVRKTSVGLNGSFAKPTPVIKKKADVVNRLAALGNNNIDESEGLGVSIKKKEDVAENHSAALGNNDIDKSESLGGSFHVPEPESLEDPDTDNIKDVLTSLVENSYSISDAASGTESSTPVSHHVCTVVEGQCSDSAEMTETADQVKELQSSVKEIDSAAQHKEIKRESTAHKVSESVLHPKVVQKDRLPSKKAVETVKPKIKREISSPTTAVAELRSSKQTTSLVRGSDFSARPATTSRLTQKAAKQITPLMKSTPIRSTSKLVKDPYEKLKSPSNLPSGSGTTPSSTSKSPLNVSSSLVVNDVKKKMRKIPEPSKTGGKKMTTASIVSPSPRIATNLGLRLKLNRSRSIKSSASSKSLKKVGVGTSAEKVKEKTIHVVERKMGNVSSSGRTARSSSTRHSPSLSLSSLASFSSRSTNSDHALNGGYSKSKEKVLRKSGSMRRQDKESTPYKLKFRRGRVVNIQSENSSGPTRLKFRPRRVVGSSPVGKSDAQRSTRRKTEAVPEAIADPTPALAVGTVVLRHQDAEGLKRETQVLLLNHVIEETASKLAETRKSKVKALVGAFESVISLRESKPV